MSAMNNFKQAVSELFGAKETPESFDMNDDSTYPDDNAPVLVTRPMDEQTDHRTEPPVNEKLPGPTT